MILNYILLGVCGIFGILGIIGMVKGEGHRRPFQTIAFILVFILVLIATIMGLTYDQLLAMIEGRA